MTCRGSGVPPSRVDYDSGQVECACCITVFHKDKLVHGMVPAHHTWVYPQSNSLVRFTRKGQVMIEYGRKWR